MSSSKVGPFNRSLAGGKSMMATASCFAISERLPGLHLWVSDFIAVLLLVIAGLLFQRFHSKVSPAVSSPPEKSIAVPPFE